MAAPRKSCPYDAKELRAAIVAAGSLDSFAFSISASPNTVRRWCRDLAVETKTGKLGRRSECPYESAEELTAAIEEAGSIAELATRRANDVRTIRRWMRELGAAPELTRRKSDGGLALERMKDAELEAMVAAVGPDVIARVLELSTDSIRAECKRRGIAPTPSASPRAQMLAKRVREMEKREAALAELREEMRRAVDEAAAEPPPKLTIRKPKPKSARRPTDVICHVSDWQYGEAVHSDTPGGHYSPEVFEEERLPRYLEAVEALIQNTAELGPVSRVWIAQGGDAVEGLDVFPGSSAYHQTEGYDAGTQVVKFARVWSSAVARIASVAKAVGAEAWVVSVVGNHGYPYGKKSGALPPSLNFDYLAYELIAGHLEAMPNAGNVHFYDRVARRAVYFETVGGLVAMTHGQEDRGGGIVGVPITTGYRNSMSARLSLSTGSEPIDPILELKGHYHRPMTLTIAADRITAWNGAWIGANNLSVGRGGASSPSQNVHVVHEEHGVIATHRVRLSGRVEAPVEVIG
jgi:hypothetical protein